MTWDPVEEIVRTANSHLASELRLEFSWIVQRIRDEARASEKEACARVVDGFRYEARLECVAAAIRARTEDGK